MRSRVAGASACDERAVQRDVVHVAHPYEKRIGRARRALVAVAATLDDEAQIVLACEVDGGDDIVRCPRCDGEYARRRLPDVGPAQRVRQSRLVADVVRILQISE